LVVVLRACKVSVRDIRDVEHTIDVTAETLYEAVASALTALQQDNWVKKFRKDSTRSGCSFSSRLYITKSECKIFCHGLVARQDRQPKLCCERRYRNFWADRLPQESNH